MKIKTHLTPTLALLLINLYLMIYVLGYQSSYAFERNLDIWVVINPIFSAMFATGTAWAMAAVSHPNDRASRWLASGLGLWASAEWIQALFKLVGDSFWISATYIDLFWVAGYVAIGLGLVTRLQQNRRYPTASQIGYGVTGGVLVVFFAINIFLQPTVTHYPLISIGTVALPAVYTLLDAGLLLGAIASLFVIETADGWNPWWFIGGGLVLGGYADLMRVFLSSIPTFDLNWFSILAVHIPHNLGYLLIGVGCLQALTQGNRKRAIGYEIVSVPVQVSLQKH